jgi:hypothetical protein
MGVLKAMKYREHMPPKVLARRRRARLAPSCLTARSMPKSCICSRTLPSPCIKATTPALRRAKERARSRRRD